MHSNKIPILVNTDTPITGQYSPSNIKDNMDNFIFKKFVQVLLIYSRFSGLLCHKDVGNRSPISISRFWTATLNFNRNLKRCTHLWCDTNNDRFSITYKERMAHQRRYYMPLQCMYILVISFFSTETSRGFHPHWQFFDVEETNVWWYWWFSYHNNGIPWGRNCIISLFRRGTE